MESLFVLAAVAGATEFLKRAWDGDLKGALTIACAAAIGGFAGVAGVEGLNVFTGVVAGLSATGTFTAIDRVRKNK